MSATVYIYKYYIWLTGTVGTSGTASTSGIDGTTHTR